MIVNAESPFGTADSSTYAGVVIDLIFNNCLPNVALPASIISPTDNNALIDVAAVFVVVSVIPVPLAILTTAFAEPAVNVIAVSATVRFAAYTDDCRLIVEPYAVLVSHTETFNEFPNAPG